MICEPIELESYSNPLRIQQVFNCIEKIFFRFVFRVFWRWRHNEGMILYIWRIYLALGANPISHIFGLSLFWKLGQNPRL